MEQQSAGIRRGISDSSISASQIWPHFCELPNNLTSQFNKCFLIPKEYQITGVNSGSGVRSFSFSQINIIVTTTDIVSLLVMLCCKAKGSRSKDSFRKNDESLKENDESLEMNDELPKKNDGSPKKKDHSRNSQRSVRMFKML